MSDNFYNSEEFRDILRALQQKYSMIKSITIEAFDGEQEILSLEEDDSTDMCSFHHILLCPECGNCAKCSPNGCYVNHWSNAL